MKIKTKKQLNLPQLIEWAWGNDVRNRNIRADQDISAVFINQFGDVYTTDDVERDSTFTVEIEEEITEDTVIPRILVKSNYDDTAKEYRDSKINDFVPMYTRAIYILNDDLTMTLIWTHDKGMVE